MGHCRGLPGAVLDDLLSRAAGGVVQPHCDLALAQESAAIGLGPGIFGLVMGGIGMIGFVAMLAAIVSGK